MYRIVEHDNNNPGEGRILFRPLIIIDILEVPKNNETFILHWLFFFFDRSNGMGSKENVCC